MLELIITCNGKSKGFPLYVNEYNIPDLGGQAGREVSQFVHNDIAPECICSWIYEGGVVSGSVETDEDWTSPAFSYVVLLNGKECTAAEMDSCCNTVNI